MSFDINVLKNDEKAIFYLRSLYKKYGYSQYKMSKFEEYDLYVRNKDFLVSDNIITFTDIGGKLMALKPDVTLSIIKNTKDEENCVQKVYYNENVYRVTNTSYSFKEIMQVGLECIGDIDTYNIYEVILLAAKSLQSISEDFMLDISHLDIVSSLINNMQVSPEAEKKIISAIGDKNTHEIAEICKNEDKDAADIIKLVTAYGSPDKVIPVLNEIKTESTNDAINSLIEIVTLLSENGFGNKINIDFSVVNDTKYYNGFVFKGFINGISSGILSGGQYDKMMHRMGKKSKAIGFAVYLDMLERMSEENKTYDVDAVLLYDDNSDIKVLSDAVSMLSANGKSVIAQKSIPEKIKYKQLLKLQERGVEIIENNA